MCAASRATGGATPAAGLTFTSSGGASIPVLAAVTGGFFDGVVTINDVNANLAGNGTITSVTLDGLSANAGATNYTINDNALTTLTINNALAGATATPVSVVLSNNQSGTTNTSLNLNLTGNGGVTTFVDTNAELRTLNFTTVGKQASTTTSSFVLGTGTTRITTIAVAGARL